jgi:hypothetical protein
MGENSKVLKRRKYKGFWEDITIAAFLRVVKVIVRII